MEKIWIDLRSDTVTKPSPEMMEAMMLAEVGDDVFEEDPSVNQLQSYAAGLFGMEAALFCTSGTQTNQIAIKLHTQPGDEIICDQLAHIYLYEGGGIGFNSGASVKLMTGQRGIFTHNQVLENINNDDVHFPTTRLVCVENTVNKGGGACWSFDELLKIKQVCMENNLAFHLDGARLFNALLAQNQVAADYGKIFDTISICLSKGLGAPVGSLLLGSTQHIHKARRIRKVLGGGMRQAGYLAAAGLYALKNNIERLRIDHEHAKEIEKILLNCPFVDFVLPVETNIVIFKINDLYQAGQLIDFLSKNHIKALSPGKNLVRFVFHLNLSDKDIEELAYFLKIFKP